MSRALTFVKGYIARHPVAFALLAYVIAAFCWGHSGVIARYTMKGYTPYSALALRLTLATLGAFLLKRTFAKDVRLTKQQSTPLTLAGLLGGLAYICIYFANQSVTSAVASAVLATESGIATVVAFALRRKGTTWINFLGGLVGFFGVSAIYCERASLSQHQAWAVMVLFVGAILFALAAFPMEAAKTVHPCARLAPLLAPMAVLAWVATIIEALVIGPQVNGLWDMWLTLAIFYLGLICTLLPFIAFYAVVERWGAARAVTMALLVPPIAFFSDLVAESEPITLGTSGFTGVGMVLLGVAMSFQRPSREQVT
jgi:drug/metabolite transporter (DMT)-like permease